MLERAGLAATIVAFAMVLSPATAAADSVPPSPDSPLTFVGWVFEDIATGIEHVAEAVGQQIDGLVATLATRSTRNYASFAAAVDAPVASQTAPTQQSSSTDPFGPPAQAATTTIVTQIVVEKETPVIETVHASVSDAVTRSDLAGLLTSFAKVVALLPPSPDQAATPQQVAGNGNSASLAPAINQLSGTNITNPVITGGSITASSIVGTIGNAISNTLATIDSLTSTTITATNATLANATTTNAVITSLTATSATSTKLYATAATIPSFTGTTATFSAATTTSLFSTTASSSNLFAQTASLGALALPDANCSSYGNGGKLTTDGFGNVICAADQSGGSGSTIAGSNTQIQFNGYGSFAASANLTFATTTGTLTVPNASTTNLSASGYAILGNATSTNFFSTIGSLTTAIVSTLTASFANITGFTATNGTTTNATSTNLYAAAAVIPSLASTNATTTSLGINGQTFTNLLGTGLTDAGGALTVSLSPFSTSNLAEGTNLYFTNTRVASVIAGTTTDALPQGATNKYFSNALAQGAISVSGAPLTYSSGVIGINQASGSQPGYLASVDWNTFNSKISSTSLSAIYPLAYNSATGVFSTAFSTTTANTFSNTNIFNGATTLANATSTSFFSTVASSTNLYAQTASLGSLLLGSALGIGQGGTNATSFTQGQLLSFNGTSFVSTSTIGNNQLQNSAVTVSSGSGLSGGGSVALGGSTSLSLNLGSANSWSALQTFTNATSTLLSAGTIWDTGLTNALLGVDQNGKIVATSSIGVNLLSGVLPAANGGTGISNPTAAGVVIGSYAGGSYQQIATSSLGLLTTNVAEGSSLYFTNARAQAAISVSGAPLTYSSGAVGISQANASQPGYLASADWTTFNNKVSSTSLSAGTGISYTGSTGVISNAGVTSIAQTYGSAQTGAITLATSSAVSFNGLTLSNTISNSGGAFTVGNALTGTLANSGLANSTIGGTSPGSTLTFGSAAALGTNLSADLNLGHSNWWSATQNFTNASTSEFTATSTVWFSSLANALLSTDGNGKLVATTTIGTNLLSANSVTVSAGSGLSGGGSVALGGSTSLSLNLGNANSWSALQTFAAGYIDTASSTHTALTSFSNATSSLFSAGTIWDTGLANALLSVNGSGQVVATTSVGVNYLTGVLPLANGGTGASTLTGLLEGNGASAITAIAGTAGQFPYYNGTNTLLATSSLFLATSGNVGVGTTSPAAKLVVSGGAVFGGSSINGLNPLASYQGTGATYVGWNLTGGGAETDFVSDRAANNGGFIFYDENSGTLKPLVDIQGSTGFVGIGTTNPGSLLTVNGSATVGGLTITSAPVNGAGYYVCAVSNVLSFSSSCSSSDERLKTNINNLSNSEGLSAIMQLQPISFNWIDVNQNATYGPQIGFLAQQVKPLLSQLVSTNGTSTITLADGSTRTITDTLSLNYQQLTVPLVKAVQQLNDVYDALDASSTAPSILSSFQGTTAPAVTIDQFGDLSIGTSTATSTTNREFCLNGTCITSLPFGTSTATSTPSFAPDFLAALESAITGWLGSAENGIQNLYAAIGNFGQINSNVDHTQQLCVQGTCVNGTQLAALLASVNQSASAPASPSPSTSAATDTPPIIAINGDNPAVIQVSASYSDLGATITGPQADLNLGIKIYLNGAFVSEIALDTSAAATDTIDYVVTDSQGLTSTSTRTVIVEPVVAPSINAATST